MTATTREMDKSRWGKGPWDQEPDRLEWRDEATGLPCLIVRNDMGALCGYAGVPKGHPWHGLNYTEVDGDIEVHGGLTYANRCQGHICHVPAPGEPDDVWWFGFDCSHAFDLTPGLSAFLGRGFSFSREETYRDVPYVREQVTRLAGQLAAARA